MAIRTAISSIQAAYGRGRVAAFVTVHAYSQVGGEVTYCHSFTSATAK